MNTPKDIACLPFSIIPKDTEITIRDAIQGRDEEFIQDMVEFGMVRKAIFDDDAAHVMFSTTASKCVTIINFSSKRFATIEFQASNDDFSVISFSASRLTDVVKRMLSISFHLVD